LSDTAFSGPALAVALWLPGSLLGVFTLRRKARTGGAKTGLFIGAIILELSGLMSVTAYLDNSKPTTPAGTYTVPITITDGTIVHSVNYTVVVQR
jgi:hypothetical protein